MSTRIALPLALAACLVAIPAGHGHAEEDAGVTLRVAPKLGELLRFRRTATLEGTSVSGESKLPSYDYEVVQDLEVMSKKSESGKFHFDVHCARVDVTAKQAGAHEGESGKWSSTQPDPDLDKDGEIMCVFSAMGMGTVLNGKTLRVATNDTAAHVVWVPNAAWDAAERETGPSSSFAPALFEGVVWAPIFLVDELPEEPVKAGSTFERDVTWTTKVPGVAVHAPVVMKVVEANGERVVMECETKSAPRLHKIKRGGGVGEALGEEAFTDASISGRLVLSAVDGLPLDVTWTVKGTYHRHVPAHGGMLHEQAAMTVRIERVTDDDE
jgi:hypothetical protein